MSPFRCRFYPSLSDDDVKLASQILQEELR
jgi:hypothetical protein